MHTFFSAKSIATVVFALCIAEAGYLAVNLSSNKIGLFASVLPTAIYDLTNAERRVNEVPTLTLDPLLSEAAQMKANDMVSKGYFAHVSPEGKTPWYWLDTVGYQYSYAGENLAVNFTDSKDVETAWMNSPTHRANIVKPQYTRLGVGVAQGIYNGKDTTFVVQMFAKIPKGAPDVSKKYAQAILPKAPEKITPVLVLDIPGAPATRVLGAEVEKSSAVAPRTFAALFTSPLYVSLVVCIALLAALGVLVILTMSVSPRKHYAEVLIGAAIVALTTTLFMLQNTHDRKSVIVTPRAGSIEEASSTPSAVEL